MGFFKNITLKITVDDSIELDKKYLSSFLVAKIRFAVLFCREIVQN